MLTQYRYFIAIAEHGGVTAAADALGVTQPALSRSLKALEFALDTSLIDRGSWLPTTAGNLLLQRARLLLADQRSIISDVHDCSNDQKGAIYINGAPMTAMALLPRIIAHVAAVEPQLRVSVRGENGANYRWKVDALLSGDLDVALTIADPMLADAGLVQIPLFNPELKLVLRNGQRTGGEPTLSELTGRRWIMPPRDSVTRAVIENEFRIRDLPMPRDTIEISDWRIVLDVLQSTDWVSAIPYHPACFDDRWDQCDILSTNFHVPPISIVFAARPAALTRPQVKLFLDATRAVLGLSVQE